MANFVRNWVAEGVASNVNDVSVYKPVRVRVLSDLKVVISKHI